MTLRTRLTLWYAAILCGSTLLVAGISYKHVRDEQRQAMAENDPDADEEGEAFAEVAQIGLWCGIPAALLGLGGGWWLVRKAMGPVASLTAAAERINERNLREKIATSGRGDELDRLTEVFNNMTTRLDASFQQIREFTLHASHELKTPLTVMRGEIETALREETLSVSQRERLLSQLDEIQRLASIVDGLTLLTKADAGQITLKKEPLPLHELVRDCAEDAKVLSAAKKITVCLEKCEAIEMHGDRHRLRQLLLNLTENAIKHNNNGGTVTISLTRATSFAEIQIGNTGPGIVSEDLPRVFERFFRGDKSHTSTVDGSGLGLSICQWIVQAHGGSIFVSSEPRKWTTVLVQLPLHLQPGH